MKTMKIHTFLAMATALVVTACTSPQDAVDGGGTLGGYFPASKDALWTYEVVTSQNGSSSTFGNNVTHVKDVIALGSRAYVQRDAGPSYSVTDSEVSFGPGAQDERIPLPLKVGSSWTFQENNATRSATVTEEVEREVPAGKFKALHVVYKKDDDTIAVEKWLSEGVGTIETRRVDDASTTEEKLLTYRIP